MESGPVTVYASSLNTLIVATQNQSQWIAEFQRNQPQVLQATVKVVVDALAANA